MKGFLGLMLLVNAMAVCFAQTGANPELMGMSSQRLARIDSMVNREIDAQMYAGRSVLLARGGEIVYFKQFGMADIATGKPISADTIFRQASMSKIITATALMILYEEGSFLLEDPVSKYIPELANPQVLVPCGADDQDCQDFYLEPAHSPITIRHLLTHTSGYTYGFFGQPFISQMYKDAGISDGIVQTEGTIGEGMRKLATMPLVNHPGEAFQYGLSMDMVGYLVEIISGKSLDAFMRERIFEPLGMVDTYFFIPDSKHDRLARVYAPDGNGLVPVGDEIMQLGAITYSISYPYLGPKTYFSGGAGLSATMMDYYRFLSMLRNGGEYKGKRILSPSTVAMMNANHTGKMVTALAGNSRGLGLSRVEDAAAFGQSLSAGSFTWGGFWTTDFAVDPERDLILLDMAQVFPNFHLNTRERLNIVAAQAIIGPPLHQFKK